MFPGAIDTHYANQIAHFAMFSSVFSPQDGTSCIATEAISLCDQLSVIWNRQASTFRGIESKHAECGNVRENTCCRSNELNTVQEARRPGVQLFSIASKTRKFPLVDICAAALLRGKRYSHPRVKLLFVS